MGSKGKILFQNKNVIVCLKPYGVLSTDEPGGMPERLRKELKDDKAEIYTVHRLDQVVGGLMVFARTKEAAAALGEQIRSGKFQKEYLAVVHGEPNPGGGRMEDLLHRSREEKKTYVVKKPGKETQTALLSYETLEKKNHTSLVKIHLETGRTHQIRAQFSSRNLPLVGDRKYGDPAERGQIALWSCKIAFLEPASGDELSFSAFPPSAAPWTDFSYGTEEYETMEQEARYSCPLTKACGGCRFINVPYEKQLAMKQKRLTELLGEFAPVAPIHGMEDPYYYRNKVHAAFDTDKQGKPICGIYERNTHHIVPAKECLLENKTASVMIEDILRMLPKFKIQPYDERRGSGFLRHVLIRCGAETKQVMVVLVGSTISFKQQKPFTTELLRLHPEITTVVLNVNDRFTSMILGEKEKVLYGSGTIEDELCGYRFRISPKSFYQVNPAQTKVLYETAIEFAGLTGKELVLDAYCGTGTIGITASGKAGEVIGVEINKDAVKDAIVNAKRNHVPNCRFLCEDAGEYMDRAAEEKESFDVVFMDPPRSGSDEKFISSMLHMKPKRIVYVSCNPETLARDLWLITAGGYQVKKIQPVDMFPHTEHVETVVCLSNKNAKPKDYVKIGVEAEDYYRIKDLKRKS